MSTTTKLKEYQVAEHNVVNLFGYSGAIPVTAGTVVTTLSTSGWRADDNDVNATSWPGVATYGNTLSPRWTTQPLVRDANSGDAVLGILRYDIREVDENGLPLKFYPQKAAENNWLISGQTVPIITKGWVFISGQFAGSVQAGNGAFVSGAGNLVGGTNASVTRVGTFWGAPGATNSFVLLEVGTH